MKIASLGAHTVATAHEVTNVSRALDQNKTVAPAQPQNAASDVGEDQRQHGKLHRILELIKAADLKNRQKDKRKDRRALRRAIQAYSQNEHELRGVRYDKKV